ncbi:hypothetical protein AJ87_08910 [Rhizobium yanglingense]|nr:hypothetical protein AJ87_08910 [Rhizobium yanglingense]
MKHLDYTCEVPSECADGTGRRSVYLTFDDGPNPFFTKQILDVLAEHRVPATFFVIGAYAESAGTQAPVSIGLCRLHKLNGYFRDAARLRS